MTTEQKQLPNGWKWVTLGGLCKQEKHRLNKTSRAEDITVYGVSNVYGIVETEHFKSPNLSNYQLLDSNWFAYNPYRINIGSIGLCPEELKGLVSPAYVVFSVDNQIVLPALLLAYLKSSAGLHQIQQHAKGTVRKTLRFNDLCRITFPLPPLEEQKRIAGILNKAEGIKKLREEADKKTEELVHAIFHEMVGSRIKKGEELPAGWSIVPFGSLAEFRNGVSFGKENFGYGMKVIGVKDFQNYSIPKYEELSEINPEDIIHEQDMLADHDLLFVRSNGNRELIGRSLYIVNMREPTIHSGFTIRARFTSPDALPKFYAHVMKSPLVRSHLSTYDGGGTNISNLNQRILGTLPVPILPIQQQQVIADRLNEAEEIKKTNAESDKKIEELQSSLLQRAFRGEL